MNRKQPPIVMHLICFVGWNAQTAMGVFQFPRLPNSIWIVQLCYVLLDGMLKLQWGFSCPKWETCQKCWFLLDGDVNGNGGFLCLRAGCGKVLVFVRRGCKRQWGVFMCQVRMSEVCWYLLDGEAVRKCACIVCASPC